MSSATVSADLTGFHQICALEAIPPLGARVVATEAGEIAVFRGDQDQLFALLDRCPHKAGPLSQGIVHGTSVTCPLHAWKIELATGCAQAPDEGCTVRFPVQLVEGLVYLSITPEHAA